MAGIIQYVHKGNELCLRLGKIFTDYWPLVEHSRL